jgi:hypothetical protein
VSREQTILQRAALLLRTYAEHGMEAHDQNGDQTPNSVLSYQVAKELDELALDRPAERRDMVRYDHLGVGHLTPERTADTREATVRIFKTCEKHKDITSWTVHPSGYALPAIEVCPVCEEIAYNERAILPPAPLKEPGR